jgi:hypothetical protein
MELRAMILSDVLLKDAELVPPVVKLTVDKRPHQCLDAREEADQQRVPALARVHGERGTASAAR